MTKTVTLTADRLEALRRARHMPRWWVAHKIGSTSRQVKAYEEKRAWVPGAHRKALAEMFGVSIPYLLGWTDNRNEEGSN